MDRRPFLLYNKGKTAHVKGETQWVKAKTAVSG